MNLILEGPKASGKSTIAKHYIDVGYKYFHSNAETKNDLDYHMSLLNGDKRVIDRFSVGEIIYPTFYKREGKLNEEEFMETISDENTIYVILYSSDLKTLEDRIVKRDKGKHIDFEELKYSNKNFELVANKLKNYKNILIFDVTKYDAEYICKEINYELGIV